MTKLPFSLSFPGSLLDLILSFRILSYQIYCWINILSLRMLLSSCFLGYDNYNNDSSPSSPLRVIEIDHLHPLYIWYTAAWWFTDLDLLMC